MKFSRIEVFKRQATFGPGGVCLTKRAAIVVAGVTAVFLVATGMLLAQVKPDPAGKLTILVDGAPQGAEPIINFTGGNGILWHFIDDPANQKIDVTASFNSALVMTLDQHHGANGSNFCSSKNGSRSYSCSLPQGINGGRALQTLDPGSMFLLQVDTPCGAIAGATSSSSCWLRIDQVGGGNGIAIKQADGVSDPGTIGRGQQIFSAALLWFDGTVFRILVGV